MARSVVVLRQPFAHLTCCVANDRILIGVVIGLPVENRNAERTLLDRVRPALSGRFNDEAKEIRTSTAGFELGALENAVELPANFGGIERLRPGSRVHVKGGSWSDDTAFRDRIIRCAKRL